MKIKVQLGVVLLLAVGVAAQEEAKVPSRFSPKTITEMKRVQAAALGSNYAYEQVAHLTDNIGPRLAGSPGAAAAVEYVAAEMKRLGLEVTLEKVTVPHWVRGEEKAELVAYPGQGAGATQKIVLTALGGSLATPAEGITAEIVVVNDFDELQALGKDKVAGKIVLFNEKFDKQMAAQGMAGAAYGQAVEYRGKGQVEAAKAGAVASLIRSVGGADYRLPHTGSVGWTRMKSEIPAGAVAAEDADLIAHLAGQGKVRMHLTMTPQFLPDETSYNVIGDLKGSEHPEQVVIVSGHLDSWDLGTGAIDDGAGVAVALETAHIVKQLGLHPKRTIRVIAWMDEEFTGAGNKQYAADHKGDLGAHYAAIESDLGAGHVLGYYVNGHPEVMKLLRPVAQVLENQGAGLLQATEWSGADISPLEEGGVPAFDPIQDSRFYFNYHHTAADTLDKIAPRELQENAAANAVLGYALAEMEGELPRRSAGPAK